MSGLSESRRQQTAISMVSVASMNGLKITPPRRSEFRASGQDRKTFAGQHEAYRRMRGFDPACDRHADLMAPEQGRHGGRGRFFAWSR